MEKGKVFELPNINLLGGTDGSTEFLEFLEERGETEKAQAFRAAYQLVEGESSPAFTKEVDLHHKRILLVFNVSQMYNEGIKQAAGFVSQ